MKYKSNLGHLPVPLKLLLSYPDSYRSVGNQHSSVSGPGTGTTSLWLLVICLVNWRTILRHVWIIQLYSIII